MKHTLKTQFEQACACTHRSNGLWLHVNGDIAGVIKRGMNNHKSRAYIAKQLDKRAGPPHRDEPTCLCNYRSAAEAIRTGDKLFLI